MTPRAALILASTSRYRRELLARLRVPFECVPPDVDEAPLTMETPAGLASRLARAKAQTVAARRPDAVVIGADQVAELDGQAIGKPGSHERAVEQLKRMSGRTVVFQTAVAVVRVHGGFLAEVLVPVAVRFRSLDEATIEAYLRAEQPYDCAGSAKSEGMGLALLEAVEADDPTALIGLPLIHTCRLLREAGIDVLQATLPSQG